MMNGFTARFAMCAAGLFLASTAFAEEGVSFRGIIRAGMDHNGHVHGNFAKQTGLVNASSLSYKILLLDKDKKEKAVNEKDFTFEMGQQFRVQIETDNDMWLYVFHEGPDGTRTILMPDKIDKDYVPMAKRGQPKVLPDDGTYFEFTPPPGKERLLVFASPTPRPELTPKEAFETTRPDKESRKKEIELKSKQDEVLLNTMNKVNKQTTTDVEQIIAASSVPSFKLRGLRWEPDRFSEQEGHTVLVGSYDEKVKPEVFVSIELKSAGK